jgi:uncharacterized protein HemY
MTALKWLLGLILTVPLAFLGWLLARDPGRISVRAWGWQIDTTLVMALAIVGLAALSIWLVYFLAWRLPKKLLARRQQALRLQFRHGLEDFSQAHYVKAKRRLLAAAGVPELAPLALLHAAKAAAALNEHEPALALIRRAQAYPEVKMAADVLRLELLVQQGDIAKLSELEVLAQHSAHPLAAQTLAHLLSQRGRAQEALGALKLAGSTQKSDWIAKDWAAMARLALLQAHTADALATSWNGLSEREQAQADVLAAYTNALVRLGFANDAIKRLQSAIKRGTSEQLWEQYANASGHLTGNDAFEALKFCEAQLERTERGNDSASALLAAAKLCRIQQLHAKAKQYLERALAMGECAPALVELGELKLADGDHAGAAAAWRKALN